MAAADGPMPGLGQKQRLKYDPIALRQPREPEYSGWMKFLRFFIHERVREVDRRDKCCGLTVWFLTVVAYGFYLFLLIKGRLDQRKQPPTTVRVETKNIIQLSQPQLEIIVNVEDGLLDVHYGAGWDTSEDDIIRNSGHCEVNPPNVTDRSTAWCNPTEVFRDVPDDAKRIWVSLVIQVTQSKLRPSTISGTLFFGQLCDDWGCANKDVKTDPAYATFELLNTSTTRTFLDIHTELHKLIKLPKLWHPSLTKTPEKVYSHEEVWSYSLRATPGATPELLEQEGFGPYLASIFLWLPEEVIIYEELEPFDVLTTFGVAAATWGSFVVVISLLLPLRPGGRRRIWPCCWRLSARLLRQENKKWDAKRRRAIHHEMDGDIEEEMKEVENQPVCDIAELELPSMEDRMQRTERVLRRLQNPSRPRKLKLRRLHQQRRQYKAQRQHKGRLFTTPFQQLHAFDEGSDTKSDLEGSGGGGDGEVKQ